MTSDGSKPLPDRDALAESSFAIYASPLVTEAIGQVSALRDDADAEKLVSRRAQSWKEGALSHRVLRAVAGKKTAQRTEGTQAATEAFRRTKRRRCEP